MDGLVIETRTFRNVQERFLSKDFDACLGQPANQPHGLARMKS